MASITLGPYGLQPVRHPSGFIRTNAYADYYFADAYATAVYMGDLLELLADGTVALQTDDTSSQALVGVFAGVEYTNNNGELVFSKYWTASTGTLGSTLAKVYVWDQPDLVFKAVADQDTTLLAATSVGAAVNVINGTGSTVTGLSGGMLDSSDVNTTAGLSVRILGSAEANGAWSTVSTTRMEVYCKLNTHIHGPGAAGIAGI